MKLRCNGSRDENHAKKALRRAEAQVLSDHTPSPPTNIADFGGFDSSTILILRGGIPRPIGIS